MPSPLRTPATSLLAAALLACGCGGGTPDAVKEARSALEAENAQIERVVEDEKITEEEARRICRDAAAGIPDEAAASDAVEVCVDSTLGSQKALNEIDEEAVEDLVQPDDKP